MNCVLTLPLTSRKVSLGCISFVFRYLLVSQNTKKKMSAWPWQHFLKILPHGIEPNDRFSIHSVCQSHSIQRSLLVETRPTPIIFFCWKHYTFLLCKWSRRKLHWHFFLLLPQSCLYCLRVILCTFLCPFFSKLFSSDPRVQYQSCPGPQILH